MPTITKSYPITFYVPGVRQVAAICTFNIIAQLANVTIPMTAATIPVGSATQYSSLLQSKVYLDGNFVGGNTAQLDTTPGCGVTITLTDIPAAGTAMTIITWDAGALINTYSGSYRANIGIQVI